MAGRSLLMALVGVACVALLAACAGRGGLDPAASGEEQRVYDAALAHLPESPAEAEEELQRFLKIRPESPLADDAAEHLARLSLADGRREDAFRWLYYVVRNYPNGDRSDSVRLRLARWELERSRPEDARRLVQRVRLRRLSEPERRSFYRLMVELSDDPVERLGHLAELRLRVARDVEKISEQPESPLTARLDSSLELIDREIEEVLHRLSPRELERAASGLQASIPAAAVRLLLAQRALEQADFQGAESWLEEAKRHELSAADQERLAALELRLGLRDAGMDGADLLPTFREAAALPPPSVEGASGSIGVVLPLTGRFAPFGQESLRGVLLAAGIFDRELPQPPVEEREEPPEEELDNEAPIVRYEERGPLEFTLAPERGDLMAGPELRVLVRDSQGKPESAAAAVRELAADDDVIAVIGPIFSAESEAAAREAEAERIPLLTLSNREQIAGERGHVFRLRTTPDDEVGFLVDYAVDVLGAEDFAVLYPKSRYGRGMRKRYWDAVLEHGGKMVAAASYEPDATDFSIPIRSMIGYSLLTPNELITLEAREKALRRGRRMEPEVAAQLRKVLYSMSGPEGVPLPPIVDFDALFIPDSHEKIQLIAPQLAFHEIGQVQLLGSSEWNHDDLLKIARKHVRGAVISTPFHMQSELEFVQSFVTAYRESFGTDPDTFSSHAFDATNLILVQLAAGRDFRQQVRDGILRIQGYPGVSGVISMLPDGNARKRPFLLSVERRGIVGLD